MSQFSSLTFIRPVAAVVGGSQQAGVTVYLFCRQSVLKWKKSNPVSKDSPALSITSGSVGSEPQQQPA